MSSLGEGVSGAWNERMRLIRLRRKKERPRFRDEIKIIPKWLVWFCVAGWILAVIIGTLVNLSGVNGGIFPQELREHPALASLALGGMITAVSIFLAIWLLSLGYVYRDSKRRGLTAWFWTIICAFLSWPFVLIGFILYAQLREPLPYPCPNCGNLAGPRFNFCPNCKTNLHPACPNCKQEIAETDKVCPYCATDLKQDSAAFPAPNASV